MSRLFWKQGKDWAIANPPRKSEQYEEWMRLKEKEKEDTTTGGRELACTADACEVVDLNAA